MVARVTGRVMVMTTGCSDNGEDVNEVFCRELDGVMEGICLGPQGWATKHDILVTNSFLGSISALLVAFNQGFGTPYWSLAVYSTARLVIN